jgi:hypothetical protein
MSELYAGIENFPTNITIPVGTDHANAGSVRKFAKELADRTKYLMASLATATASIAAINTILGNADKLKLRMANAVKDGSYGPEDADVLFWNTDPGGDITIKESSAYNGQLLEVVSFMDNDLRVHNVEWDGAYGSGHSVIVRAGTSTVYQIKLLGVAGHWRMIGKTSTG